MIFFGRVLDTGSFARCNRRKVAKWKMMARGLIETLQARGTWAATRRVELKLEAREAAGIEVLKPEVGGKVVFLKHATLASRWTLG